MLLKRGLFLLMVISFIKEGDAFSFYTKGKGVPELWNCVENVKTAKEQYFLIKNGFTLPIVWNTKKVKTEQNLIMRFGLQLLTDSSTAQMMKDLRPFYNVKHGKFVIPPYTAEPGTYAISMSAMSEDTKKFILPATSCYIHVMPLPPVIVLSGGVYRKMPPGIQITLSAEKTIDPNRPLDENNNKNLRFSWACTAKKYNCEQNHDKPVASIPASSVVPGNTFKVTLTVRTLYNTFANVTQTIDIVGEAEILEISCEKNCPPVTDKPNVQTSTYLRAFCTRGCQDLQEQNYEWEVTTKDKNFAFNYVESTEHGRFGTKFTILKDVFKPDTEYFFTVRLKDAGRRGEVKMAVKYARMPGIKSCEIQPPVGTSLHTKFKLFCEEVPPPDKNNFYELYNDDSELVVSGFYGDVFTLEFLLPPSEGRNFTVKVSKSGGPAAFLQVTPEVSSAAKNKTPVEVMNLYQKFLNGSEGGVSNLILSKDPDKKKEGIAMFRALVNEIAANKPTDEIAIFAKNITVTVVHDILHSPPSSTQDLVSVGESIADIIMHHDLALNDPELAKFSSSVCKLMIESHAKETKSQEFPLDAEAQFRVVGGVLTKCLEANVRENFNLVRPVQYNIAIESFPVSNEIITENYPNYQDYDDNYTMYMENLNSVTYNVLNATMVSAKSLALSTPVGEHFAKTSGQYSTILVAKDLGKYLAKTKITLPGCVLIPSKDFEDSDHPFDILIATWSKDLMWWNHNKTRVVSDIVNIQFWHSSCKKRITNFKESVDILIDVTNTGNFDVQVVASNVTVSTDYNKVNGEDLNRYIRVHRIGLIAGSIVHIEFQNISELDIFDVVVTESEFPTMKHFSMNKTVATERNTYMMLSNPESTDKWGYVGVLPSKRQRPISAGPVYYYSVTFIASFCVRWNRNAKAWQPDCKPGFASSRKVLNCRCKHFSAISAYMQNAESLIQVVEEIEVVLEIQVCYVIFITVAVTFMLYLFLSLTLAFRKYGEVYFLADNVLDHRYAYLVLVRTENKKDAGTTSKVMIKLIGANASSAPHVLNYPDPKMRLLQRQGEDMFLLATEQHLGDIVKIELWFDCSGPSTSWYQLNSTNSKLTLFSRHCRDVVVYDLQLKQQWYFKIRQLFAVIKGGVTTLTKTPYVEEEIRTITDHFRICNNFHTWELWASEKNFPYPARLTVVLSNILMIYSLLLIFHGIPEFKLRDVLDPYDHFYLSEEAISHTFICSFISFVIHVVIAWMFRFSAIEFIAFNKVYRAAYRLTKFCWILVAVLIALSTSFLITYGFWVPTVSSQVLVTCGIIAILFDIIILENMFIIVQTFFCKFKLTIQIDQKLPAYMNMIRIQRQFLSKKFDREMLRPFMAHLYAPLKKLQITRRRIVVRLRRSIYNDLEDLVMYGIYNAILYVVILVNRGQLTIVSKNEVYSMVQGEHTRTLAFTKVRSTTHLYEYLNQTLIPTMQSPHWYGNFSIPGGGLMIDNSNKYIGVARLRQHRIGYPCKVPEEMKFLNMSCWPPFSLSMVETRTFGAGWTEVVDTAGYDRMESIWKYQTVSETETIVTFGRIATYSGGGYVAYLGRILYNSYINVAHLVKKNWLDTKTRSVFVDFLVYNANYNVFIAVSLLFEDSAAGYFTRHIEINVVRMLFVENEVEIALITFFILFVIIVALLMLKLVVGIWRHIHDFYKRVWLMIDLVVNVMSIVNITIFIVRMNMVKDYLDELERMKHNGFVSYFNLLYVEEFLTIFAGILVCIATVRLWKFLRFGLFFRIMERTLSMGAYPLLAVTFAFGVILTAYGFAGMLIFGNEYPELSSFIKIVATLIQLALKPDQFDLTDYLDVQIAYWYFALYLMMMQVIMLIYITVIIMAYVKAQLEFSVEPDSYTVIDYIQERADYLPKLFKTKLHRIRGGAKEKTIVTPKADEFRYANCVGVQRSDMQSMKFIVWCIVRNLNQSSLEQAVLTEFEVEAMLGVCRTFVLHSYDDDDMDLFFKGHFEGEKKVHLVDEKKIMKMAEFVQMMFRSKSEESEEQEHNPVYLKMVGLARKKLNRLQAIKLRLKLLAFQLDEMDKTLDSL